MADMVGNENLNIISIIASCFSSSSPAVIIGGVLILGGGLLGVQNFTLKMAIENMELKNSQLTTDKAVLEQNLQQTIRKMQVAEQLFTTELFESESRNQDLQAQLEKEREIFASHQEQLTQNNKNLREQLAILEQLKNDETQESACLRAAMSDPLIRLLNARNGNSD